MRIAFDYQTFCNQTYGGISRYFVRLIEQLVASQHNARIFAPLHQNRYVSNLPLGIVRGFGLPRYPPRSTPLFIPLNRFVARRAIGNWQPDIVHETFYSPYPSGPATSRRVITVYDMIHERFKENYPPGDPTTKFKRMAIDRADHVICISQSTRRDLIELFGTPEEKVSCVHLGIEEIGSIENGRASNLARDRQYLLYVGGRFGHKNFARFLRSVAASPVLKRDFDVVAFGGGSLSAAQRTLIKQLGFRASQVRQVDGDDFLLGICYEQARAFVYPSLYEGFGLPPLEAMAHNCPVISSNTSSMPEVIGEAAEFFDPYDMEDMTRAIESVVYSDERVRQLRALGQERLKKFSWRRCSVETLIVYESLLRQETRQPLACTAI